MFDWLVLLVLAILVGATLLKDGVVLRAAVLLALVSTIVLREISIDSHYRSLMYTNSLNGQWTEQYGEGARAILDYCKETRVYPFAVPLLIIVLCFRGLRRTKPNTIKP
jgi:hypothetical protein